MMEIHLPFSLQPIEESSLDLGDLRPEDVRRLLCERGYTFLVIDGPPFAGYRLPVEDDAEFLCDAYLELNVRVAGDGQLQGEHHVCLDDGRVQIDCSWQRAQATIEIRILEEALGHTLISETVSTSLESYVGGWYRLIAAMVRGSGP